MDKREKPIDSSTKQEKEIGIGYSTQRSVQICWSSGINLKNGMNDDYL